MAGGTGIHVALLRGINLGPNNRLSMKDLAALFTTAGCERVAIYIQSGNVVFQAGERLAGQIAGRISGAIAVRFGFDIRVVTRTAAELHRAARSNPFLRAGADPDTLHVSFLADRPSAAQVAALDRNRSLPDEFAVVGREIYLRLPKGMGRSKLTNAYFEARLGTTSTVRNWRTVLALVDMAHLPTLRDRR
ncbi:MAG TPA: DUF1697 domain-containing protein [Myxococcaceae bacterium]|nr:DUF1697 domain-containing protein [Myxococcaceae bacterium]